MDLDPAAVEEELAAVKLACNEVSKRLRQGKESTGILSRLTGESSLPSTSHSVGQNGTELPSSRRYVNRDWQAARRRTAAGLFSDDLHGEGNSAVPQLTGRAANGMYDPHDAAYQQRARFLPQGGRRAEVAASAGQEDAPAQLEEQRVPSGRHQWDRAQQSPGSRQRDPSGIDYGASSNSKNAHGQLEGTADDAEDEQLDALPQFVAERRPDPGRVQPQDVRRNKRMLGSLIGHLQGAEKQFKRFEETGVASKRRLLEEHARERARIEGLRAKALARRKAMEARQRDISMKRELMLQHNMKEAKLLCAKKVAYTKGLLSFLRTRTVPPVLWAPASVSPEVKDLYRQQEEEFALWADTEAARLQEEQVKMRERAERRWKELDAVQVARFEAEEREIADRVERAGSKQDGRTLVQEPPATCKPGVADALEASRDADAGNEGGTDAGGAATQEKGDQGDGADDEELAQHDMYLVDEEYESYDEAEQA